MTLLRIGLIVTLIGIILCRLSLWQIGGLVVAMGLIVVFIEAIR